VGVLAVPPPPYNPGQGGRFYVRIVGDTIDETVQLVAFAGCFDKVIAVEYEDCYFSTGQLAPAVAVSVPIAAIATRCGPR
jgi:hypothetical protein